MKNNLTIINIARMAGVSKSTVSRVLNNDRAVKPETKEKVLRVIEENGYFPNEMARALVRKKSNLVGLITPFKVRSFYRNEYFRDILRGVNSVFKEQSYDVIISSGSGVELDAIKKFVQTYRVCGIILLYSIPNDPGMQYMVDNHIPFSLVGASEGFSGIGQVTCDYSQAMEEIMDYLIRHKRTKIAFFQNDVELATVRSYIRGYRRALDLHGIPFEEKYLVEQQNSEEDILATLKLYRQENSMPEAIIVSGDAMCMDLFRCCRLLDICVPEDLAVFSLENGPADEILGVSSLDVNYVQMGVWASRMLLDMLEEKEPVVHQLGYEIFYRRSTEYILS